MTTIKIFRSSRVRLPKASTTNPIYSAPPAATPKGLPAKALNLLNGTLPHISISGGCIPGRFRSCRHLHHSFHFIIIWTTTTGLPSSPHELLLEGNDPRPSTCSPLFHSKLFFGCILRKMEHKEREFVVVVAFVSRI